MSFSQNVTFKRERPQGDDHAHPPGQPVLQEIATALETRGWTVSDIDVWRDCGWEAKCERSGASLLVVLAHTDSDEWMMQIAPLHAPGWLGKKLGQRTSASRSDVLELARAVHAHLAGSSAFAKIQWKWDGYPNDSDATTEPSDDAQH